MDNDITITPQEGIVATTSCDSFIKMIKDIRISLLVAQTHNLQHRKLDIHQAVLHAKRIISMATLGGLLQEIRNTKYKQLHSNLVISTEWAQWADSNKYLPWAMSKTKEPTKYIVSQVKLDELIRTEYDIAKTVIYNMETSHYSNMPADTPDYRDSVIYTLLFKYIDNSIQTNIASGDAFLLITNNYIDMYSSGIFNTLYIPENVTHNIHNMKTFISSSAPCTDTLT